MSQCAAIHGPVFGLLLTLSESVRPSGKNYAHPYTKVHNDELLDNRLGDTIIMSHYAIKYLEMDTHKRWEQVVVLHVTSLESLHSRLSSLKSSPKLEFWVLNKSQCTLHQSLESAFLVQSQNQLEVVALEPAIFDLQMFGLFMRCTWMQLKVSVDTLCCTK